MKSISSPIILLLTLSCGTINNNQAELKLYGQDDRVSVLEIPDSHAQYRNMIGSVAMIVNKNEVSIDYQSQTIMFDKADTIANRYNFCPSERFAHEISVGVCTGFFVGKNIMVTAGHCVAEENSSAFLGRKDLLSYAIFDYHESAKSTLLSNVYNLRILEHTYAGHAEDWAIVELTPVLINSDDLKHRTPIKYRRQGNVAKSVTLSALGHPTGLPMQLAKSGRIISNSSFNILAEIDSAGGGSGSPVFNDQTLEVEGIYVRTHDSSVEMTGDNCRRYSVCIASDNNSCVGSALTRITDISEKLDKYLQ